MKEHQNCRNCFHCGELKWMWYDDYIIPHAWCRIKEEWIPLFCSPCKEYEEDIIFEEVSDD